MELNRLLYKAGALFLQTTARGCTAERFCMLRYGERGKRIFRFQ
jgi:hypothetical protein